MSVMAESSTGNYRVCHGAERRYVDYVSNQIVDGRRYCDPCAKPVRFKSEREKMEFESSGKAIFFEKVQ